MPNFIYIIALVVIILAALSPFIYQIVVDIQDLQHMRRVGRTLRAQQTFEEFHASRNADRAYERSFRR